MDASAQTKERDDRVTTFLEEVAEELAYEEHDDLSYQRDHLPPHRESYARERFDDDHNWRDDRKDYFAANRNYFIEQAREWLASEVAA